MNRSFKKICLLWSVLAIFLQLSASNTMFCPFLSKPQITIDGKGDDPVWNRALTYYMKGMHSGQGPGHTKYRIFADERNLYIFGEFGDLGATAETGPKLPHDQINWSDTAEFFLAATENPVYYHIAIDSDGNCYDSVGQVLAHDFKSQCEYKVIKNPGKGWQFEIRFPLREMNIKTPLSIGDCFDLNVCRTANSLPGKMFLTFMTNSHSYHNRSAFGSVRIGLCNQVGMYEVEKKKKLFSTEEYKKTLAEAKALRTLKGFDDLLMSLNNLEREKKLEKYKNKGLLLFETQSATLPTATDLPEKILTVPRFYQEALQGEYLNVALGLFNPTTEVIRFRCVPTKILDFKNLIRLPFEQAGSVSIVREVPIRGGATQRDPLPELRIEDVVTILPRTNEIIYLTLDTSKLTPGQYAFSLDIMPLDPQLARKKAFFNLEVYNSSLAKTPEPFVGDWAYGLWPPVANNLEACRIQREKHGTKVQFFRPDGKELGFGQWKFSDDGKLKNPDFALLEKTLRDYGPDYTFIFPFRKVGFPKPFWEGAYAEENWRNYLNSFLTVVKRCGIDQKNIWLYLDDEPKGKIAGEGVAKVGKILDKFMSGVFNTFVTADHNTTDEMAEIMGPYITVWCPLIYRNDIIERINKYKREDCRLMGYKVLSRSRNPYADYRLTGLTAWKNGMFGIGLWSYSDAGRSEFSTVWDDFDPAWQSSDFAVIYEGSAGPVSSVRYEMWRQGIQDYRFAAALKNLPGSEKALKEAELATLQPQNSAQADKFRAAARRMLAGVSAKDAVNKQIFCLTGNSLILPNLSFKGSYSVDGKTFNAKSGKAAKLLDGNFTTRDGSLAFHEKIEFDLSENHRIDFVMFNEGTQDNVIDGYMLEASTDKENWTQYPIQLSNKAPWGYWYAAKLDNASCRYLRLKGPNGRKQIIELLIYGH